MLRYPRPNFEAPNDSGADGGAGGAQPPVMPEGLPADFWDADAGQVKFGDIGKRFEEMSAVKTQHDERMAGVPEKADDYKLELPEDFKTPDGFTFTVDEKDPAFGELRAFAHEQKLPQSVVSKLLAIEASRQAQALEAHVQQVMAEEKALGANFPQRKAAMESFLRSNLDQGQYDSLRPFMTSAKSFEAIESLIEKATAGGIPNNDQGGGKPAQPRLLKDLLYPEKAS